ncbi:MAG: hypothetical protein AAF184_17945 [Pseudomonadota bacterium]
MKILLMMMLTSLGAVALAAPAALTTEDLRGPDAEATFAKVADSLVFAPYAGILRGGDGAVASGRGNSLDQSVTLAMSIAPQVAAYRFARGRLDDAQARTLLSTTLRGAVPPDVFPADAFDLYEPSADATRLALARDHYWLEVKLVDDGDWLALDPTFPGAQFGRAVTAATSHLSAPPRQLMHQLSVTLMQETGAGVRKLGGVGGAVAQLALSPISVEMMAAPATRQIASESSDGGATLSGLGGGFAGALGGQPKPKQEPSADTDADDNVAPITGLQVDYRFHFAGKDVAVPTHQVDNDDPATHVKRVWIAFDITRPDQTDRRYERVVYEAVEDAEPMDAAGHRRYSALVTSGAVSDARFAKAWEDAEGRLTPEEWAAATQSLTTGEVDDERVDEARALEAQISVATGHLAALSFAHQSDRFSTALARRAGVQIVHRQPRLLLVSVESTQPDATRIRSEVNIDLRLDEVDAIPLEGAPTGAARLFQRARGLQESTLEGAMLTQLTGSEEPVVTTVALMEAARAQGIEVLLATPAVRSAVDEAPSLAAADRRRMHAALDAGYHLALPARGVAIAGGSRYGWWQTDPVTGSMIGVMQGGEHQAMVEKTTLETSDIVSPQQAYLLGMFTASIGSQTLIAAELLKSRGYTQALRERVKAKLEYFACAMCPEVGAEISISASIGGGGHPCYQFEEIKVEVSRGKKASPPWCPYYKKGFACAASLLLGNLQEDFESPGADIDGGIDVPNPLTQCEEGGGGGNSGGGSGGAGH